MKVFKSASTTLLAVFLAFTASQAFAANPTRVGSTPGASNISTSRTPSCACATDDFIIFLFGIGGSPASPVVADTHGAVTTDFAFNGSIGLYHVANAGDVSHTVSVTWGTAPTNYYITIVEASGSPILDTSAGTPSVNSGSSANPTTGSLTAASGDMLLAGTTSGLFQSSGYTTWTNGLTKDSAFLSGPSFAVAYLNGAGAGSINTQTTFATSTGWNALLVAYKGEAAAVCTDAGVTNQGVLQVPNGTSGLYLTPSGTYATPDCATVQYWEPPAGACSSAGHGGFIGPQAQAPGGVGSIGLTCPPVTYPSPQGTAVVN